MVTARNMSQSDWHAQVRFRAYEELRPYSVYGLGLSIVALDYPWPQSSSVVRLIENSHRVWLLLPVEVGSRLSLVMPSCHGQ